MDNIGQHGNRAPKEITHIISRNIKPGHEKDYDDWLQRYMKLESEVPGYLGTTILAPGVSSSSVRYVINRFADKTSLDAWENLEEARKLIKKRTIVLLTREQLVLGTNLFKNDLKTIVAPPRWKMAIVAFTAAYCIKSLAQYFIKLYLGQSPLLANVVMNMILVLVLTYFAMPLLSRLLRRWLYPRNV